MKIKEFLDTELNNILTINDEERNFIKYVSKSVNKFELISDDVEYMRDFLEAELFKVLPLIKSKIRYDKLIKDPKFDDYANWKITSKSTTKSNIGYQGFNAPDDTFRRDGAETINEENNPIIFINYFQNMFSDAVFEIKRILMKMIILTEVE